MVLGIYVNGLQALSRANSFSELCALPCKDLRSCSNLESLMQSTNTVMFSCLYNWHTHLEFAEELPSIKLARILPTHKFS